MNKYQEWVQQRVKLPSVSIPGGYPIVYMDKGYCYCADCATKEPENIVEHGIHWEGAPITCESCNCEIESAYGEVEA